MAELNRAAEPLPPGAFYALMGGKLGVPKIRSDADVVSLVERRLPATTGRRSVSGDSFGANDEAAGRRAHEVERITSDQGQRWVRRISENLHLIGSNDFYRFDLVLVRPLQCVQGDDVSIANVTQGMEKRISMCGNGDVSRSTR